LRTFRVLLLLPFLVMLLLYGYSFIHQHQGNAVYDEKDPRHVFSSCQLLKIKKVDSSNLLMHGVPPAPVVWTESVILPKRTDVVVSAPAAQHAFRATTCPTVVSCPNRGSPASAA
jgi:hypothetical protein